MSPQSKYSPVHPERELHDDSSTDVSESLMGRDEEKGWAAEQDEEGHSDEPRTGGSRKEKSISELLRPWRWTIDTVLLLFIVVLLLERKAKSYGVCQFESTGDLSGFAPKISQQIKTFVPDFSYAPENASEFFSDEVQKKWIALVPKGLGYVKVDDPENYNNLPTPLQEFTNKTVFTTSVTHQLHCLHAIVEGYSALASNSSRHGAKEEAQDNQLPEDWHLHHCFEYLRQNILCCGDTALEGEQTTFPSGISGSDGWDARHVCKNYDQIYGYLEENRAQDIAWI